MAGEPEQSGVADTLPAKGEKSEKKPASQDAPSRKSSPTTPPPPGEERYQLGPELGRGGMGRVVEAYDAQLGRKVALKEVLPRAGVASNRRFSREVALTARLEHHGIVPLYDAGTTPDGRPFYVMRRLTGRPLDELIMRSRKLDERLALLPNVQSAIDAVAHAHERGVIHRDLKPANILCGELGETVVIDWGLAKVVGEEDDPASRDSLPSDSLQTQMGSVFGTPGFMAPEQARGDEIGTHGDVYALGATLYQLLAGTPPHSGNSATDVIDKTLRHHMIPLHEIAPGAPAELVTIVNKALAPEPEQRYPHARALGDDLRRFLTGQLVAAHEYTSAQRFMRFARKHRATLAVTALAMVALAVLAWVSVKRVLHERDVANVAKKLALEGRSAAEKANAELAERHDALLVSNARSRIDLNPTEALATLKHLPEKSAHIDEARAVAQAATLRGVTWAIQSTLEFTTIAEMSADSKQLLQVSRDGMVRVWDLDRRRLELQRPFPANTRAVWIAKGKLLVTQEKSPPMILDPQTNTVENLTIDPIKYALPTAIGDRVMFYGERGAGVLDVATKTVHALTNEKTSDIAVAPDGKAFAWTEATITILVDGDFKEIARFPKRAVRTEFSSKKRLFALLHDNKVFELELDAPKPVFKEVIPPGERRDLVIDLTYRGRELVAMTGRISFWGWDGTRSYQRGQLNNISSGMKIADEDFIVVASSQNRIFFLERQMQGSVQMPANLAHPRLVARADSSRVLMIADGIILGFDMEMLRPKILTVNPDTVAEFVDDDTILATHSVSRGWEWIDINTEKSSPIDWQSLGPIDIMHTDTTGRVLVGELGPKGRKIFMLTKNQRAVKPIIEGDGAWATLVQGNAIVYSAGDAKVMAIVDDGPPKEVAKMTGIPDGAVAISHLKVAVHSTDGELARIDLATGTIERTSVALGTHFIMHADPSGRVVIAEDNRVLLWDGVVTQIASFDKPIGAVAMLQGTIGVTLRDNETYLVEPRANVKPWRVFPPSRNPPRASKDGRLLVAVGNAEQIEVLEIPSRARWTVPQYYKLLGGGIVVSPNKRRVLQHSHDQIVIWTLPQAPAADFAQWLDEQTNATVDVGGEILWPWQTPNVKQP